MRLLFFGDVVGRSGRDGLVQHLPAIRDRLAPDFIVVNGENAAGGFGITAQIARDFYALGVDVISTGNHAFDQKETLSYIGTDPRLLRPRNYPATAPGRGAGVFEARNGKKVLVVNVMGRIFMDPLDDPFAAVETELAKAPLGEAGAPRRSAGRSATRRNMASVPSCASTARTRPSQTTAPWPISSSPDFSAT